MSKFADRFREIPKHLQQITSEQAEQARNTNLVEYLSNREELVKVDNHGRYRLKEHDSLVIRDCYYWWNSRNEQGNSLDFVMSYYRLDFKTAVAELTNSSIEDGTKKRLASDRNTLQVSKEFSLPDINKDMRRTFAYLIKTRCIDKSIIQNLVTEQLLMQDQRGNAVFPWYNENGKIVGAEIKGTLDQVRFEGIAPNSAYGYGYNIKIGTPKLICFFESAIDLLSFWTIYKDKVKDALLVSMGGLKEEVIEGFLKRYTSLTDAHLGVDNDDAGKTFIKDVQAKIQASPMRPPKEYKDWNDYLQKKNQDH